MHILCIPIFITALFCQPEEPLRIVHVHVALCDNENQGIVPVPAKLGNGLDTRNNLYWGALYGVKSYFKRSASWTLLDASQKASDSAVLERLVFKHKQQNVFLIADAYRGDAISGCIKTFLKRSNRQDVERITVSDQTLSVGGGADLVAYIGHNGLMEFTPVVEMIDQQGTDALVLACASSSYFTPYFKRAKANPILQTSGFMAPEAYTLEAALAGWVSGETKEQIGERAAQAYHKYQKCGVNGARRLFTAE